ncbi:aldo/keto reductase [Pseudomonas veronii]|jgi:aryl-alcohol dehydrogenase-like predicted oxidoreductase|uniref:aldo/keto reductase n=1 Tax=Pseudomonas TaxID=286 RepID=UPI000F84B697|nr:MULTISPECIES: aldo/keto reductase [Pseudomonas]MDF3240774.1 aldo/keto reductase [Pseudomonas veronii]MDY7553084.1 aldo/keto reductase [Pseudomonas sp. FG1]MEB0051697.1 aldo/keto reductase [Pseudomonas sp. FG1]RTY70810.1 aldo/keto reductase [Pseudomonas veronii]
MELRKLGKIDVSAIGLGCMGLSQAYGVQDETSSIQTLHRAVELGVTFFDTAEVYGPYRNEILLGKALKPYRERVVIATKFGFIYNRDRNDFGEITGTDGRPENARAVAHASLKRLDTDVIDLYYLHRVDPAVPIEESVGAMAELVTEGKVRAIGLSEVSADTLRRAHAIHPITALQSEYSLWTRDVETNGVLDTCRELGISFVPFSPLGRGFLTGKAPVTATLEAGDFRHNLPRFQPGHVEANRRLVSVIEEIAAAKGVSAAQVALAWVLAQGNDIIPIPGAKRLEHLEQNVAATRLKLTEEECTWLEATFSPENISGDRYPAAFEVMSQK